MNGDRSFWRSSTMIHLLVENGANALARTSNGDSVLHILLWSVYYDDSTLEIVKLLVGYGCDPLEADSCGETPLHIAVKQSNVSAARYLITQGASVLTKASNGNTMLHFAAGGVYPLRSHLEDVDDYALGAVKFLVWCGCEPAAPNDNGETPLHIAVHLGRIRTIKYLLSLNIPLPHNILFTAIQSGNIYRYRRDIIETLVTSGCNTRTPNSDGDTPLKVAIMRGEVDVVEYLLSVVPEYSHNVGEP
ncbi:ankyrin repeat-containing domain protein, partial [Boletus coccyginus]